MPSNSEQINKLDKRKIVDGRSLAINELLTRGVQEILPSKEALKKELESRRRLRVYLGIDPTAPFLHLGHVIPLLVLKRFAELGHKTILLIGDFTAQIGDPSGKTSQRRPLSKKEVLENSKTYKAQVGKILKATLAFNSKWLEKLTLGKVVKLASSFTVQQMLTRDMFQERIKKEKPIGLHEFLYPLMQGYDSVALETDVEVGGSDQLFNMKIGRDLVKQWSGKEKYVVTTKLLVDPESGVKMSKSEGSLIALNAAPDDIYAKAMALPDELTKHCFELCTEVPIEEVRSIMKLPPREAKARFARAITAMFHGVRAAQKAEEEFEKVFSTHGKPSDIQEFKISEKRIGVVDLLVKIGLAASKSEARRFVEQGGVALDDIVIKDWHEEIEVRDGMVLRVGRRRFTKLKIIP